MTDTPPVPPTPGTPSTPPAAPAAGAPAPAGPAQTLSLVSFIAGIASFILSWVPVLGFLAPLAAIIVGFIARKKEPAAPKWMSLIGIILGFIAIGIGLIVVILFIISAIASASYSSIS